MQPAPRARDDQDGTVTPPSSAATPPLCPRALPQVRPDISLLIYPNSLLKAGQSPLSIPDNLTVALLECRSDLFTALLEIFWLLLIKLSHE